MKRAGVCDSARLRITATLPILRSSPVFGLAWRPFAGGWRALAEDGETVTEQKSSYTFEDLIECAKGRLFGPGNAQLPLPPMLMFDRIVRISDKGGKYDKGEIVAELDVKPDLWFFACHFKGDPVMPGCLGLDALWQMCGFFLGWMKAPGRGRALGVGEVKLTSMIVPTVKKLTYHVHMKRVILRRLVMGIADGIVHADDQQAFEVTDMKVGLFKDSAQPAAAAG
jgi:3-hydroxyacyl-[acyl-carrier protein] dehydratase/trans-2-decenoyl-[acyl-carrier protein] isomerase